MCPFSLQLKNCTSCLQVQSCVVLLSTLVLCFGHSLAQCPVFPHLGQSPGGARRCWQSLLLLGRPSFFVARACRKSFASAPASVLVLDFLSRTHTRTSSGRELMSCSRTRRSSSSSTEEHSLVHLQTRSMRHIVNSVGVSPFFSFAQRNCRRSVSSLMLYRRSIAFFTELYLSDSSVLSAAYACWAFPVSCSAKWNTHCAGSIWWACIIH